MERGRLHGLDALRGIAALIVAASHFKHVTLHLSYIQNAGIEVDFFFMLSGYIMARTYEERMPDPPVFLWLRMRRLWPAFALGTLLGAMLGLGPLYYLPIALLFLPIPGALFAFNNPAWSLFCELIGNFAHSAFLTRRRATMIVLAALIPLWAVTGYHEIDTANRLEQVPGALLRVAVAYTLGVVIWRRFGETSRVPAWLCLLIVPLSAFASFRLGPAIILFLFPIAILSAANLEAGRVGQVLGRLSYPLYAVHYPLLFLPLPWPWIVTLIALVTPIAAWVDGLRLKMPLSRSGPLARAFGR